MAIMMYSAQACAPQGGLQGGTCHAFMSRAVAACRAWLGGQQGAPHDSAPHRAPRHTPASGPNSLEAGVLAEGHDVRLVPDRERHGHDGDPPPDEVPAQRLSRRRSSEAGRLGSSTWGSPRAPAGCARPSIRPPPPPPPLLLLLLLLLLWQVPGAGRLKRGSGVRRCAQGDSAHLWLLGWMTNLGRAWPLLRDGASTVMLRICGLGGGGRGWRQVRCQEGACVPRHSGQLQDRLWLHPAAPSGSAAPRQRRRAAARRPPSRARAGRGRAPCRPRGQR
jgi:hypothetical protein